MGSDLQQRDSDEAEHNSRDRNNGGRETSRLLQGEIDHDTIGERVKATAEATRKDLRRRVKTSRTSVSESIDRNCTYIREEDRAESEERSGGRVADLLAEVEQQSIEVAERVGQFKLKQYIIDSVGKLADKVSDLIDKCDGIKSGLRRLADHIEKQVAKKRVDIQFPKSNNSNNSPRGMTR